MTAATMFNRLHRILQADTMTDLARRLGVSHATVLRALHGGTLSLCTLERIHARTRVPMGILAEWWAEDRHDYHMLRPGEQAPGVCGCVMRRMSMINGRRT